MSSDCIRVAVVHPSGHPLWALLSTQEQGTVDTSGNQPNKYFQVDCIVYVYISSR